MRGVMWTRGVILALIFAQGCTVAIDEFERCEAPAFQVERASCVGDDATCTLACFTEDDVVGCLESCVASDSPCLGCLFNITAECAVGQCPDDYQDVSCCSLERCGTVDFTCEACVDEITSWNECAANVSQEGAACGNLLQECY